MGWLASGLVVVLRRISGTLRTWIEKGGGSAKVKGLGWIVPAEALDDPEAERHRGDC